MKNRVTTNRFMFCLVAMITLLGTLNGCIKEDLSACPAVYPTGKVWITPSFTMHNQKTDGVYPDLFVDVARRIDLFIFDAAGVFVKKVTEIASPSFTAGYRIPVELEAGTYRSIAWVNLAGDNTTQSIPNPIEGETTLEQLSVQLSSLSSGKFTGSITPLFYGDTGSFTVKDNVEQDVPVNLIRDTNRLRFDITWFDRDTKLPCNDPQHMHVENTRIYIDDNNGVLGFDNLTKPTTPIITYIPTYLSGPRATTSLDGVLRADVDVLRLMTTSTTRLRVCYLQGDKTETLVYDKNLIKTFIEPFYKTQEELDRTDLFDIKLELECNNDSWIVVKVTINGWILMDNGDADL
ncbi:MAG: FimB/Mfa2 family fimbrial subunit [Mucinivorans sp.]